LFAENRLVSWLLNIVYGLFFFLSTPWLIWRMCWHRKNRTGWKEKLFGLVPRRNSDAPCIWLHAVSVGEVNLLQPLVLQLQQRLPAFELVISTTTETGYRLASQKFPAQQIFYFPFDFSWGIKNALRRIRPNLVLLTELEIWPNFIRLSKAGLGGQLPAVSLGIINGRLSESSHGGYRRWGWMFRSLFQRFDLVCVQDAVYAERFIDLGCLPAQVMVTGNIKFDGVTFERDNPKSRSLQKLLPFPSDSLIFLAGSTQENEDYLSAEVYRKLHARYPQLRLILVPRHPERGLRLQKGLQERGFQVLNRSKLEPQSSQRSHSSVTEPAQVAGKGEPPIVLVDVIGELSAWWGVADIAYVGGSMGQRGGQSMIEPAAYGIPVSFGPDTRNFRNVVQRLLDVQGGVVVQDQKQLESFVERVIIDPSWAKNLGNHARTEILRHQGAAAATASKIEQLLAGKFS